MYKLRQRGGNLDLLKLKQGVPNAYPYLVTISYYCIG